MNAITSVAAFTTPMCDVKLNGGNDPGDNDLVIRIINGTLGKQLTVVLDGSDEVHISIRPKDSFGKMQSITIDAEALAMLRAALDGYFSERNTQEIAQ